MDVPGLQLVDGVDSVERVYIMGRPALLQINGAGLLPVFELQRLAV